MRVHAFSEGWEQPHTHNGIYYHQVEPLGGSVVLVHLALVSGCHRDEQMGGRTAVFLTMFMSFVGLPRTFYTYFIALEVSSCACNREV